MLGWKCDVSPGQMSKSLDSNMFWSGDFAGSVMFRQDKNDVSGEYRVLQEELKFTEASGIRYESN
jgi:hypothetical protein